MANLAISHKVSKTIKTGRLGTLTTWTESMTTSITKTRELANRNNPEFSQKLRGYVEEDKGLSSTKVETCS